VIATPVSVNLRRNIANQKSSLSSIDLVCNTWVTIKANINLMEENIGASNLENINEPFVVQEIPCFFQIYDLYGRRSNQVVRCNHLLKMSYNLKSECLPAIFHLSYTVLDHKM
jgi:hypothetical protein